MYQSIYVPVDNSDHSNRAIETSIRLGQACQARLVGSHVYSAKMHDYRFRQMEFTLPEEYLEEQELFRQRKIHDSLITMGLELVSDCYLSEMQRRCHRQGVPFEKRMMDGKHTTEILKDLDEGPYDLVVLGAHGIGQTRDAQLGSVAQRVSREARRDVWIVKHLPEEGEVERDTILVGLDGSPESFGALQTALDLAEKLGKRVELVSVYDPYLHYSVFKGIVGVLTDEAAKVFRFEEQNQLHEEIIDTGLAEIYQSHLNVGEQIAAQRGVEVSKTLLDGKAFQKVLDHSRKVEPFLLVIGRIGIHQEKGEAGLGSNTDNLVRLVDCDVLLTTRRHKPELDIKAEESIQWTPEAEAMLTRAPELVRGLARTTILRLALQQGHSVVTSDLVTEAMDRYMPKRAQDRTKKLAEALAFDRARTGQVAICSSCNTAAFVADPVKCTTCGGTEFDTLSRETVDRIAAQEGGIEEETAYDGRTVRWTQESRAALRTLSDAYQRRRAKARIEKAARRQQMNTITLELAQRFIEEEAGVVFKAVGEAPAPPAEAETVGSDDETRQIVAHDPSGAPLVSELDWTPEAVARIFRVPKGFMRNRTQTRVEEIAVEDGVAEIDLGLVERGIEDGLLQMKEMLGAYAGVMQAQQEECPAPAEGQADSGSVQAAPSAAEEAHPLKEVSIMSELAEQRRELGEG